MRLYAPTRVFFAGCCFPTLRECQTLLGMSQVEADKAKPPPSGTRLPSTKTSTTKMRPAPKKGQESSKLAAPSADTRMPTVPSLPNPAARSTRIKELKQLRVKAPPSVTSDEDNDTTDYGGGVCHSPLRPRRSPVPSVRAAFACAICACGVRFTGH
jgi:hypothetical protein